MDNKKYLKWKKQHCNKNNQPNPPTPPTPVVGSLTLQGMRDLAIPYKTSYEYTCDGGTLSVDGDLPNGFHFDGKTLTFDG
ncbi:MAG: hypothetical protein LBF36_00670, partial [Mycoplasmataceae bacterium]|nr:hypothetical protein [Mycoplasmataceae bacterium]